MYSSYTYMNTVVHDDYLRPGAFFTFPDYVLFRDNMGLRHTYSTATGIIHDTAWCISMSVTIKKILRSLTGSCQRRWRPLQTPAPGCHHKRSVSPKAMCVAKGLPVRAKIQRLCLLKKEKKCIYDSCTY